MGRILYSENIGFDMSDWQSENVVCVAAGSDCVLALTADGRVLTKSLRVDGEEKKPSLWQKLMRLCGLDPAEEWKRVKYLAVSGTNGVAVGLRTNGSCVIRQVGTASEKLNKELYRKAQNTVSGWKNIVSVSVSDAIFGLDSFGRVYCAPLTWSASYRETAEWRNIVRLVPGSRAWSSALPPTATLPFAAVSFPKAESGRWNLCGMRWIWGSAEKRRSW